MKKIALDSCSILHLLSGSPQWKTHFDKMHAEAFFGSFEIIISEVSVAECCKLALKDGKTLTPEESTRILSAFFRNKFIVRRGITRRESELAARLIREKDLGPCDGLIAATAALADATILFTTDGCSGKRKAGKLLTAGTIEVDGRKMAIQTPDQYSLEAIL